MRRAKKKKFDDADIFAIDQYSVVSEDNTAAQDVLESQQESVYQQPQEAVSERTKEAREHINRLILQDIAVSPRVPEPAQANPLPDETPIADVIVPASKQEMVAPIYRGHSSAKRKAKQIESDEKPSQYVLDLRKHFLIEKYNLDTLAQPRARFRQKLGTLFSTLQHRERIQWHYPDQKTARQSKDFIHATFEHTPQERELEDVQAPAEEAIAEAEPLVQEAVLASAQEPEAFEMPVPWKMRVFAVGTFWIILVLLLSPIPVITYASRFSADGKSVVSSGMLAFSNLKAGVADITNSDYTQAQASLVDAQKNFSEISQTVDSYSATLTAITHLVPGIGSKVSFVKAVGEIGEHASAVGLLLADPLRRDGSGPTATDTLKSLQTHLASIADILESSEKDIQRIDLNSIPPEWKDQFAYVQQHSDEFTRTLRRASKMLDVAIHILGSDTLTRYLVVFQNSRELRPTGGFMGSFALIDFSKGTPLSIDFPGAGTYDLDGGFKQHLLPPKPISVLNAEWHIWDSNWWPDFPTSAKKISWFYQQSGGRTVDGVIAVNSDFVVDLLKLTGPIEMPEYGVTVDADSFYSVVQKEVEVNYDKTLNQPKKILKDLMPKLIDRLNASSDYRQILAAVTQALDQKDIQIAALTDADTQQLIGSLGWDGAQNSNAKDYLSVISTNIAGEKSDAAIYETIDHHAIVDDAGTVTVTTTVTKEHHADPSDKFAYVTNVDYMRFYVPLGSTLVRANGFKQLDESLFRKSDERAVEDQDLLSITSSPVVDEATGTTVADELGHTVFGNWMQVEPGGKSTVSITYTLPFKITIPDKQGVSWLSLWGKPSQEVDAYSLLVQRQSGKKNTIFNSSLVLPDTYSIVWSDAVDPDHTGTTPHVFTYSNELNFDTYYALLVARKAKE